MRVPFSELPGRHERHFRRKLRNELFPDPIFEYTDAQLLEVQRLDHEELSVFVSDLRDAVQQAVELKPNEESQVVLDLKERLDKLYETASGLADDQAGNKSAIRQLIAVIMRTVRAQAGDDALAAAELEQEEEARTLHFALLGEPLVEDLLHPSSAIGANELVPTLLSETEYSVSAALELFDAEQLGALYGDAARLLSEKEPQQLRISDAHARLQQMGNRIAQLACILHEGIGNSEKSG